MRQAYKIPSIFALTMVILLSRPIPLSAADCNNNGINDALELTACRSIEVVFLIDTSGSTATELETLCANIIMTIDDLTVLGIDITDEILRIGAGTEDCICCAGTVPSVYGTTAPGMVEELGNCFGIPNGQGEQEDWAPATAVVSANKVWTSGSIRIIVPFSDEGPRCGNPVDEDDECAVVSAGRVVSENQVIVMPVMGDGAFDAVLALAEQLAAAGALGGQMLRSTEDLVTELTDLIGSACVSDCNSNSVPDICDIHFGPSEDCFIMSDGIPDECQTSADCNGNEIPDAEEIFAGSSVDCNNNCILDECDIASTTGDDCNANTVLDECDIASGEACDLDGNGVPDECGACCDGATCANEIAQNCSTENFYPNLICGGLPDDPPPSGRCRCDLKACCRGTTCDTQGGPGVLDCACAADGDSPLEFCGFGVCDLGACCTHPGCLDNSGAGIDKPLCDATFGNYFGGVRCSDEPCAVAEVVLQPPTLPVGEAGFLKNRYVSIVAGNAGVETALRVTLTAVGMFGPLPDFPDFSDAVGRQWWVGEPFQVCENSGQGLETAPPNCGPSDGLTAKWIWVAQLVCGEASAHSMDWAVLDDYCTVFGEACTCDADCAQGTCGVDGVVHIVGQGIVSSALIPPIGIVVDTKYDVQAVFGCDLLDESAYSSPLSVTMGRWGDIVGFFDGSHWTAPDGDVDITCDVVAVLDKFSNTFGAPIKSRSDIHPEFVNTKVEIIDVLKVVNAFEGENYPFAEPCDCDVSCP